MSAPAPAASPALQEAEALSQKILNKCFGNDGGLLGSPIDLIKSGMVLVKDIACLSGHERKECLVAALQIIAKGKDGVAGTEDDVLAPETMTMLNVMLEHNIVEHVVEALLDAAKGRLNVVAIKDAIVDVGYVGAGCMDWCVWRNSRPSKK